jgi:putative heme-binding domain-containing protein
VKKPKIEGATTAELLEALKQPEQWTRDMARQELLKKGKDELVKKLQIEIILPQENDKKAMEEFENYLLSIQALSSAIRNQLTENEYISLVENFRSPLGMLNGASAWAGESPFSAFAIRLLRLRMIGDDSPVDDNEAKRIGGYFKTESPRVRLEMIRMLGQLKNPLGVTFALRALNHPIDRFLDYALWLTVRELEPQWLPAFREGKLKFDDPKHLLFAVQASGSPELVEPLLKYLQQNDLKGETADALWGKVAELGGPKELMLLWEQCNDTQLSEPQLLRRLLAIEQAVRQKRITLGNSASQLNRLMVSTHDDIASSALRLAGVSNSTACLDTVRQIAFSSVKPVAVRVAAIEALAAYIQNAKNKGYKPGVDGNMLKLNGEQKVEARLDATHQQLIELAKSSENRALQLDTILRIAQFDLALCVDLAVDFMHKGKEAELQGLLPALLQKREGPQLLTKELLKTTLPPDVAKIAQRIARSTGQVHQPLIDALAKAGKLNTAKWEATPVVMKDLLEGIAKEGNAARGELIYRRKELNCLKCHGIGGSGGQIGPDMTSIGASAQPDYLIESLLLPSKAIKENFNTTVVSTVDGKVLTGIKQRENKDELILRDAEGNDVKIPIKDIEGRADGKSLMPEGLVDGLTRGELVDLVRFLTELGKVGNYSVGTTRIARTWEVLAGTKTSFDLVSRNSVAGVVSKPAGLIWSSEYATVGGQLPLETIPDVYTRKKGEWSGIDTQIGFARTRLEVGTAGEVLLSLNDAKGVQMWLDQQPLEVTKEMTLKLTPGSHVLTMAVNKKERSDGVRVELKDVAGSAAQGRWVLGR